MSIKVVKGKGGPRYMKDGKFISKEEALKEVPTEVQTMESQIAEVASEFGYTVETNSKPVTDMKGIKTPVMRVTVIEDGVISGRYAAPKDEFNLESFRGYLTELGGMELVKLRQKTAKVQRIMGPTNIPQNSPAAKLNEI